MTAKMLIVVLIVGAALGAPKRSDAAGTGETSQLLLPAVGLVAGLIGGKVLGSSMGIAAFGTAISGKIPGAIIGGLISATLAAQLAPPTMSLADILLVGIAISRLAIQLTDMRWQDVIDASTELARRAGSLLQWAAETARRWWGAEVQAAEPGYYRFTAPEWPRDRVPGNPRTTVIEFREIANPGALVPNLTPKTETWKGQPVR